MLYLTGVTTIPNEAGEEKIARANGKKTDDNQGYSKEFFREMGIRPPKELEDDPEYDEDGRVILTESDLEDVNVEVAIPLHLFGGAEDLVNGTTLVYTSYGYSFCVEETTDEITSYIHYLSQSWWEKTKASIKMYFRKKNKN